MSYRFTVETDCIIDKIVDYEVEVKVENKVLIISIEPEFGDEEEQNDLATYIIDKIGKYNIKSLVLNWADTTVDYKDKLQSKFGENISVAIEAIKDEYYTLPDFLEPDYVPYDPNSRLLYKAHSGKMYLEKLTSSYKYWNELLEDACKGLNVPIIQVDQEPYTYWE